MVLNSSLLVMINVILQKQILNYLYPSRRICNQGWSKDRQCFKSLRLLVDVWQQISCAYACLFTSDLFPINRLCNKILQGYSCDRRILIFDSFNSIWPPLLVVEIQSLWASRMVWKLSSKNSLLDLLTHGVTVSHPVSQNHSTSKFTIIFVLSKHSSCFICSTLRFISSNF